MSLSVFNAEKIPDPLLCRNFARVLANIKSNKQIDLARPFVSAIRRGSRLAFIVRQVSVSGRLPGELGTAARADGFRGGAGLLPLVPEKIAERRELTTIAAVIPALRLFRGFDHYWFHIRWHTRAPPIAAAIAIHST